VTTTIFIHII
jgi:hypothetical protein